MRVQSNDQRRYPHGVPSWVDTEQPDLDMATRFYGALFGWSFADAMPADAPGSYLVATLDGHDVAAIAPSSGDARWNTYIACDDADTSVGAVRAAGGAVLAAPQDAGPAGRSAICADPQGAVFRLWQARRRLGAQLVNSPGSWNFSDLHTADLDRVLPFYASIFGWQVDAGKGAGMVRVPGYGDHLAATVDPDIYQRQANAPAGFADVVAGLSITDDPPGWHVRFAVADRDASVASATQLGATILHSTETMWTREAVIRDPQGAELTLSQFAPPV
jgi:predicted enzyme related to lactoylglutathione lyase